MSLLRVDDLTVDYGGTRVVDHLNLHVDASESVGLVGESGSGKTQTALAIMGLLPRAARCSGSITLAGNELLGASEKALNKVRATRLAMVFQDPMQALNPYVRVGNQLRRVLIQHRLASGATASRRALDMLKNVGLSDPERQYGAYPHQLSGGMRQRAMIAAALIAEPDVLLADEPTTSLDVTVQAQILELLEAIRKDTALLLISHDLGIVAGHCARTLVLERGALVESGTTSRIFAAPQHPHTALLLAAAPRLDRGETPSPPTDGNAKTPVLEIENASVRYQHRGSAMLNAVRDISLTVRAGETVAVIGESGSGKSSLVRAALGIVPMHSGRVAFCGAVLSGTVQTRAVAVRRDLQLVFQDPVASLNPQMRVLSIIAEQLLVHAPQLNAEERLQRVTAVLDKVGLDADFLTRYPHQLSGGQAQRVAIARALIVSPKVLVCDEAVAALDGSVRQQILRLLRNVQEESGLAIIFITHDLGVARAISHRLLVMYMGKLAELADSESLFRSPRHPYSHALLAAVPVPDPNAAGGRATLQGEVPSTLAPPSGCAFHPRCVHAQDICAAKVPPPRDVAGSIVACHRAEELSSLLHPG